MSSAQKLWKEQHLSEVSKLQQQLREATPSSSSSSSLSSPGTLDHPEQGGMTVDTALQQARKKWNRERRMEIQEAVDAAKQVQLLPPACVV